jgi:hypothetical protein
VDRQVTDEHRADRDTFVLDLVAQGVDRVLARVAIYGESIRWLAPWPRFFPDMGFATSHSPLRGENSAWSVGYS